MRGCWCSSNQPFKSQFTTNSSFEGAFVASFSCLSSARSASSISNTLIRGDVFQAGQDVVERPLDLLGSEFARVFCGFTLGRGGPHNRFADAPPIEPLGGFGKRADLAFESAYPAPDPRHGLQGVSDDLGARV